VVAFENFISLRNDITVYGSAFEDGTCALYLWYARYEIVEEQTEYIPIER
jgi:hypothetical protein